MTIMNNNTNAKKQNMFYITSVKLGWHFFM